MDKVKKSWLDFERYLIQTRYSERDENGIPLENAWIDIVQRFKRKLQEIKDTNFVLTKIQAKYGIEAVDNIINDIIDHMEKRYVIPATPSLMTFGNRFTRRAGYFSCYPLGFVNDNMESIYQVANLMKDVYMKGGGIGIDVSLLRPHGSLVDKGQGIASGPVSFLRLFDSVTGTTNQGGRRRGALLVQMHWQHHDIKEFVTCKNIVGKLSSVIYGEGLGGKFDVPLQNMNISVVTDEDFFMKVKEKNKEVEDLLNMIVEGIWRSGDPGLLFRHNMEKYSPFNWIEYGETHKPWFSNPCGEYLAPAMTACNLVTINVAKMAYDSLKESNNEEEQFKNFLYKVYKASKVACNWGNIVLFCDEGYPCEEIKEKTQLVRPVGIGMTGLHSAMLLLKDGNIEYGDEESCLLAKTIQLTLCLGALQSSVEIGQVMQETGSFEKIYKWRKDYLERFTEEVEEEIEKNGWYKAFNLDTLFKETLNNLKQLEGAFNSVVTSQAPTGSVSQFARIGGDTGIEPMFDIELKRRVRDFEKKEWKEVVLVTEWLAEKLKNKDFRKKVESQLAHNISPEKQLKVMEAVQKFCHTGISKTVNVPFETTQEQIKELLYKAMDMRLKGFTVFRDGCRVDTVYISSTQAQQQTQTQIPTQKEKGKEKDIELEEERNAKIFEIKGPRKIYVTISFDQEGNAREIFLNAGKAGTSLQGMLEGFGRVMSIALRHHPEMIKKFIKTLEGIETGEWYKCQNMQGRSIPDVVAKILKYISKEDYIPMQERQQQVQGKAKDLCSACGKLSVFREGNCKSCKECGWTTC